MYKLNEGVPKLRALSPSITLCEDNTVAIKTVPDDSCFVVSEKYLQPGQFFIIETQKVFHEIPDHIHTIVKCCLINDEELKIMPLDRIFIPNFKRVRTNCIDMHVGILWNLMRSGNMSETRNGILHNLLRHHWHRDERELRQNRQFTTGDMLLGEHVAICYIYVCNVFQMYIVCKQDIYVQTFYLHTGPPRYLLIEMAKSLKQFRTIPLYDIPSLQGLCRSAILKHIKQVDGYLMEKRLEQLPLEEPVVKKLMVHAELEKGYTGKLTEKPIAKSTKRIRFFECLKKKLGFIHFWKKFSFFSR